MLKMISLFIALIILGPVCNVRRIIACPYLPVAFGVTPFPDFVLIAVTRPRVMTGRVFCVNPHTLGNAIFPSDCNVEGSVYESRIVKWRFLVFVLEDALVFTPRGCYSKRLFIWT